MINWRSTWSIYTRELMRFLRTGFQSVLSPVLTTSLYFIVFGAGVFYLFRLFGRTPEGDQGELQEGPHRAAGITPAQQIEEAGHAH